MNLQKEVENFCMENDMDSHPEYRILDMVSEMREVAKEALKSTSYGKKKMEISEEIKGEVGDLFFSLITVANSLGIDMEEALRLVMEKYRRRLRKGGAGSEND